MKTWTYGINTYYRTAHYVIEQGPWWAFFIRWLADHLCDFIPRIPFPSIRIDDEERNKTTLKNEWGDLSQWVHVVIHAPVFKWVEGKIHCNLVPAPYEEIKQHYYTRDKQFFDEQESLFKEEKSS